MIFQALENLQVPASEQPEVKATPHSKPKLLASTGAVIAGLGLGLLATEWMPMAGSMFVIGSVITASGILLMLFR